MDCSREVEEQQSDSNKEEHSQCPSCSHKYISFILHNYTFTITGSNLTNGNMKPYRFMLFA